MVFTRHVPVVANVAHENAPAGAAEQAATDGLADSVSSPSLAGIVNLAGHFAANTVSELGTIYANRKNTADFRDVLSGTVGSFSAKAGYDFVTGVGSNQGLSGK